MTLAATIKQISPMPDIKDYVTTEEAAKALKFHVESIRLMVRRGTLEAIKVGPTWLVSRKSIEQYKKDTGGMSKHDPRRSN